MNGNDIRPPSLTTTPPRLLRVELLWLLAVLVASSALVVRTSAAVGPTFDEPFYITKGLEYWRTGSPKPLMRAGTMPLPVDVQTLPLHLWECSLGSTFDVPRVLDILLPVARTMALPFWWLLLVSGFRLARLWGGRTAGAVAVGLLGFEPNLIGHAALATTDVAVTGAILAATCSFARGQDGGWWKRVVAPGLWAGVAVLCKASAVTFVPMIFLLLAWWHGTPRRQLLRDGFATALVAAVVVFGYVGTDWAAEPSFVKWANSLPEGDVGDSLRTVAHRLRIFPNAAEAVVQQVKHNIRGHGCFTLGEWYPRAIWYYFPVVLSQKLPEPVLALLAGLLLLRPRSLATPAGLIALALLLFSLTCRVQIGLRLVFPLVTFLILAVAVAAERFRWCGYLAVVGMAAVAFSTAPHGLRYQNHLWGDPARAGARLADSNYDWGQGIPELREWWRANREPRLHVWYYGTDSAAFLPPFRRVRPHVMPSPSIEEVKRECGDGYLAVGKTFLTACPDRRPDTIVVIDWLNSLTPVADVGCHLVYKFR